MTPIIALTDQVAHAVYGALCASGLHVPEDISVAGCDDTQESLHPALTRVRRFPEEAERHVAEFIARRVWNSALAAQSLTIATRLVNRESGRLPAA